MSLKKIVFNEISTGASGDIEQATKIAREMVMSYGMSDLGPIQYEHSGGNVFLGRDYNATRNYSSQIAFEIDKSVRALIDEGQEKAKVLILEHRTLMDKIVEDPDRTRNTDQRTNSKHRRRQAV